MRHVSGDYFTFSHMSMAVVGDAIVNRFFYILNFVEDKTLF